MTVLAVVVINSTEMDGFLTEFFGEETIEDYGLTLTSYCIDVIRTRIGVFGTYSVFFVLGAAVLVMSVMKNIRK